MVVSSILNQSHQVFLPSDYQERIPDTDQPCQKEQESISLVKGCKNMEEFRQVHGHILKLGLFLDPWCASTLVATCALSDWGSMEYACSIFRQLSDRAAFDYNAIIRGHVKDSDPDQAMLAYVEMLNASLAPDEFTFPAVLKACAALPGGGETMQVHGKAVRLGFGEDVFMQNSLISAYGKSGARVMVAQAVFDRMAWKTVASWSAVIAAHAAAGMWAECLSLFSEMIANGRWRAEESTLASVLSACSRLGALEWGSCTHTYLLRNLTGLNVTVETALMDMYVRCGSVEKATSVFRGMRWRNLKSYSAIISGLASHGRGEEALKIFEDMVACGWKPDDVVYVGVLSACSNSGMVEEGLKFFDRMRIQHRVQPTIQHYGCLVDLMGRAGRVREAFELIMAMPMKPNDIIWRSLLSSCKIHGDVKIGEIAAANIFQLNTKNACDYLMLSNLYAQARKWQDASVTRVKMASMGIEQVPGSSLVEVKRKVHRFVSYDMSHPQRHEIDEMLHQMEWQLKFEGYRPDTSQVLLDVDEEEKQQRLRYHSQKLAIAFSLINTAKGSPIRITRNVRMCGDCHSYTKLISEIYEREIIVRDRKIFHHFKDGTCSCKDYW